MKLLFNGLSTSKMEKTKNQKLLTDGLRKYLKRGKIQKLGLHMENISPGRTHTYSTTTNKYSYGGDRLTIRTFSMFHSFDVERRYHASYRHIINERKSFISRVRVYIDYVFLPPNVSFLS